METKFEERLIIPKDYKTELDLKETAIAIKEVKDYFERALAKQLNLIRVSAPLFVRCDKGLNDNLNGVERPVKFTVKDDNEEAVEIVHSLAKWKRMALYRYNFNVNEGLYTDMDAIRRDEDLDNTHSIYVDQWDWERIIRKEDRNEEYLKDIVRKIFKAFKETEEHINKLYPFLGKVLPEEIFFMTTQELEDMFPDLTPKEREDAITKEKKAVFLMKIGKTLESGEKHDGRAPDYDDWELNGDILFWNPVLNKAFELSSMGIRVDEEALLRQLKLANCEERKELEFHKMLLEKKLPYTIGGGIGQSRMCMLFLKKAHIGEVQSSIWPEEMIKFCKEKGIMLL
ncbi:aspartate--ammonia ligase [Clostridium cochlearium]|uniref:Aspartate--ammonia ligase n=1 Tax=Clostridium cochlearium TaxID=1494 RepID=A0A239ZJD2_CLOCO|nr:aspartate--ammonia ligase [Clostridium cochlearium]MBU5269122.1 aspartate--ammonia ligase [Clostridium cochlearium]MCG4571116.1 aspartate--ammonia ligase [Clostridium cochlearium]MCR1971413.1 aspartate--ammonia ligase [Clostridium cochlearium]MDU1442363.1 aspartate--ammonia ligase [Clostridium cochlearium]NOH17229.1 aspartate--ammonia ligase [Clostridium cochlearium]